MSSAENSVFDTPAYSSLQAAHYVGVPYPTLRSWIGDQGLIRTAQQNELSFNNLAEAHIVKSMRRRHGLSLQAIRRALSELERIRGTDHPLLDETFETDGVSLCIRDEGEVVNLTRKQQTEIREFVSLYLHRVERNENGKVARLYPFVVSDRETEPRSISISPTVSFGKPVLTGTGISTSVIVGRFNARDSIEYLAREYSVAPFVLEDAIRWELSKGKSA